MDDSETEKNQQLRFFSHDSSIKVTGKRVNLINHQNTVLMVLLGSYDQDFNSVGLVHSAGIQANKVFCIGSSPRLVYVR